MARLTPGSQGACRVDAFAAEAFQWVPAMRPLLYWFEQRAAALVVALLVFLALVGGAFYLRFLNSSVRLAEGQVDALATRAAIGEQRAAQAEASLTSIAQAVVERQSALAAASATALASQADPRAALERALNLVFETYKEPTDARTRALADAISPNALPIFRPELDQLQSTGTRLGGESTLNVEILSTSAVAPDRTEIRTRERWVYDERDATGARARCVREASEQLYTMQQQDQRWILDQVQLISVERSDC